MLNRIADRREALRYDVARSDAGPMDEDAAPRAAAALAAVTDAVPVGATERPWAHAGRVAWRGAVLVVLIALAYLPTLLWPNLLAGEADAYVHQPLSIRTVADWGWLPLSLVERPAFGAPPLVRVLLRADGWLGNGPRTHRAAGLVLHAGVTVGLWLVLRRLSRPGAWLAAAAFAVDPGSAAAAEWLGLRGRTWAALLAIAACWLLLRACAVPEPLNHEPAEFDPDEEPRGWRLWLSLSLRPLAGALGVILLLAAALCQPTAAVATGLIVILLVAWRRGLRPLDLLWVGPVLLLVAAAAVAACRVVAPAAGDPSTAALPALLQPLWWAGRALERVAWPLATADLATAGSHGQVLATCGIGAAVVVLPFVLGALRRRIGAGPAVAAACFALLLPTVSVPPAVPAVPWLPAAEQAYGSATYLVAIPVLVLLADAVVALARLVRTDLTQRVTELAGAAVAVLVLAGVTVARAAAFDDTEAILKTAVTVNGRSWADRGRLAEWFLSQRQPDLAGETMVGLTRANCPDGATAVTQGDLLAADGDMAGALQWYQFGRTVEPGAVAPVVSEAALYLSQNRVGDAIDTYEGALAAHPNSVELRNAFGAVLVAQGQLPLAIDQFRRSLEVDPDMAATHVMLATALIAQASPLIQHVSDLAKLASDQARQGQTESRRATTEALESTVKATTPPLKNAAAELQAAIDIDPENFEAFHNDGLILHTLGDDVNAARMLQTAVRLRPDLPLARNDLAVALIGLRKFRLAEFELKEALRLQPDLAAAKQNLEVCRHRAAAEQRRADVAGK